MDSATILHLQRVNQFARFALKECFVELGCMCVCGIRALACK